MSQNTAGATPFPLGVFVGNPNYFDSNEEASFEANFSAFSTLMKSKPQFIDQYGDQRLPVSGWVGQSSWNAASMAQSPVLKGVTPVIGLPMTSTASGSGTPDQFYKDFAAGKYDSVLQGMVKAWADNGFTTQIWRPGWEMNIDTMPSYAGNDAATRADWVKAFQHISTVLHAAGQANGVDVKVAWNPSVVNYSNASNVIKTAYPGNQYVDIIAADVYGDVFPYGTPTHLYDWDKSGQVLNSSHPVYDSSVQQWATDPVNLQHYYTYPASNQWSLDGSAGHATTLQQLIDLAKSAGKPFAIAETGAGNTHDGAGLTDNPTFVKWLADTLHQSGVNVSFVNAWDSNSGGQYRFTSSADHKPLEAAAWAKYFGDPPTATSASASASTPVTTTSSHTPVLTIADPTLSVHGKGGTVDLGVKVATTDPNDVVTASITGLPQYETITDKLDGKTFNGNNVTLTAEQVDSGLTLTSNYTRGGDPASTLTLTAIAKDPVSGAVIKGAPHTITVTDPPPATAPAPTSPPKATVANSSATTGQDPGWLSQHQDSIANGGTTTTGRSTGTGGLASQRSASALLSEIRDLVANSGVANSGSGAMTVADDPREGGSPASCLASHSFALLSQSLAGQTGRVDPGQVVTAGSNSPTWVQDSFLTRPQKP
ncbi:hypothetical protein [Bradyrhizobium neotropicale]|uniref:GH26 domain-containing protein n=1 Tax=Bradyrhizobium neotropicale TaxID=1497615 RepID=A0A176Z7M3_9BRAD|nr:hypothetical protein [Bradyrhizobium neotropicale]OAF16729.1 hypothetical protein AXW67_11810 [Bradyrhizobium neotropicale]